MREAVTYIPYGTFGGPHAETLRYAEATSGRVRMKVVLGENGSARELLTAAGLETVVLDVPHLRRPALQVNNVRYLARLRGIARQLARQIPLRGVFFLRGFGLHNLEVSLLAPYVPTIWTVSGTMTPPISRKCASAWGERRKVAWMGLRGLSDAYPQTYKSERMTEYLPPVPDDFFTRRSSDKTRGSAVPRVGLLGALSPIKGLPRMIEALHHLRSAEQAAEVIIAGPPVAGYQHQIGRIAAMWSSRRAESDIQLRIEPWHHSSRSFLGNLDLLVVASDSEGFPNVAGEALASGVPVASTPVGALPQLLKPPLGMVAASMDASDLATCIRRSISELVRDGRADERRSWAIANLSTQAYVTSVERAAATAQA